MQLHPSSLQRTDDQKILGIDYTNLKALCSIHGLRLRDSNRYQSTEEAHNDFMNSYRKIFLRPKKMVARNPFQADSKVVPGPEKLKASESQVSQEVNRNQGHGRQTQETLISQMIKALKKL